GFVKPLEGKVLSIPPISAKGAEMDGAPRVCTRGGEKAKTWEGEVFAFPGLRIETWGTPGFVKPLVGKVLSIPPISAKDAEMDGAPGVVRKREEKRKRWEGEVSAFPGLKVETWGTLGFVKPLEGKVLSIPPISR
ncbi:MAG: hypothetical protein P4K83_00070, partial [Terracidiphilus sp.]|nr:hypothetical protein [Terracidiphilus sp.]